MGYFAQQSLDLMDADLTIIEQLQNDFPREGLGALRSLAGAFQFSGDDIDKKIRALSGGEKSRLAMARMLFDPPNFLVLDEPTNHLDLATKEMLVDSLKAFEGTMIFVSHDRTFLRGLGSRVLELGGESGTDAQPHAYPGSLHRIRRAHRPRSAGHSHLAQRLVGTSGLSGATVVGKTAMPRRSAQRGGGLGKRRLSGSSCLSGRAHRCRGRRCLSGSRCRASAWISLARASEQLAADFDHRQTANASMRRREHGTDEQPCSASFRERCDSSCQRNRIARSDEAHPGRPSTALARSHRRSATCYSVTPTPAQRHRDLRATATSDREAAAVSSAIALGMSQSWQRLRSRRTSQFDRMRAAHMPGRRCGQRRYAIRRSPVRYWLLL